MTELEIRELKNEIHDLHAKNHWLNEFLTKTKIENRALKLEIEELRKQLYERQIKENH